MHFIFSLTFVCAFCTIPGNAEEAKAKANSSSPVSLDDRININYNVGHAHAYGKDGSYSSSDANSYGYSAGILHANRFYQPLANHASSQSKSYSHGQRPPSAFTNTGVQTGPGAVKGHVNAGYSGGQGNAFTSSNSQHLAIDLGGGAVLLSNLPETPQHKKEKKQEDEKKEKESKVDQNKKNDDLTKEKDLERLFLN